MINNIPRHLKIWRDRLIEITKSNSRMFSMLGQSGSVFGVGLIDKAKEKNDIVILTADMAIPAGLSKFSSLYPDMFFNIGIAEQNLVGMAAGISNEGFRVIASAQACFLSMRSYEQVRQYSGYMGLPIIFVGVSSGFALTYFGNTHYALEDVTLMRSIPGMTVVSPADGGQAIKAMDAALNLQKPVYIRCTGIPGLPPVYSEEYNFEIGKGIILDEGEDVILISSGSIISRVSDAAVIMRDDLNMSFKVIDMHTVKPLDEALLSECLSSKIWVTIEEHFVDGGLGSAVANFLSAKSNSLKPNLLRIGVEDQFSIPGDYEYMLKKNGLNDRSLVKKITDFINMVF
jgi:transketolase